jgi:hypothetical protein
MNTLTYDGTNVYEQSNSLGNKRYYSTLPCDYGDEISTDLITQASNFFVPDMTK